jgi:hypothetical protein
VLIAICALAVSVIGRGDELDDRLKVFRTAIEPHLKAIADKSDGAGEKSELEARKRMQTSYLTQSLVRLVDQAGSADAQNLDRKIRELRQYGEVPSELQELLDGLVRDLPKLIEQRVERRMAEIDTSVKSVAPACLAAKTEAELDPLLRDLSRVSRESSSGLFGSDPQRREIRRLQGAIQTVTAWQDYLAHLTLGHTAGATAALKRLLENQGYPIIERSEIEKRLILPASKEAVREDRLASIARVERIEDLERAVAVWRQSASAGNDQNEQQFLQALNWIVADYVSMSAGFYGEAFRGASGATGRGGYDFPPPWKAQIARLRALLLVKVLPRYLELPDISRPNAGEGGSDYLLRLIEELIARRRFAETVRVIDTYRTLAFGSGTQVPAWIAVDMEGLRSFAAADRFAQVQLWPEAINGFRRAAETTGRFTPSAEAAQRVAELSKAHPEEAQTAARLAEAEATYQRLSREAASGAQRAIESRLPPEIRSRMQPPPPGFPP